MSGNQNEKNYSRTRQVVVEKSKPSPNELPLKQFIPRNSPLTDLYQNKHFEALYHGFLAILLGQFLHSAVTEMLYKDKLNLGLALIQGGFHNIHWIAVIWLCMFSSLVSVYFGFKVWATFRMKLTSKSTSVKFWDTTWVTITITYYIGILYFPGVAMGVYHIQPAAKFGFVCESYRMLMKAHAFIRSNAPNVLKQKRDPDKKLSSCPTFGKFMYFVWAPTLLYRESYPRTASIRWGFVINHLLQLVAAIFFASFVIEKYIIDVFKDYGRKPFIWQEVAVIVFSNTPIGVAIVLGLFYIIQHTWMNACAEVFTFADRLFYQDWWTVTSYKDYYRKWNVLVQDWIYEYMYKDFYELITPNKALANYLIFFISALAHEYITAITFGFYKPFLFILFFGFGVPFTHLDLKPKVVGSVFFWYTVGIGMSIISTSFAIEYFYTVNCPVDNLSFTTNLLPRYFTCQI